MSDLNTEPSSHGSTPDYEKLVRFLIEPFLESPEALKLDCEISPNKPRIWIRLAFDGEDKGRVFGRGGRNIQSIRTVLGAVGKLAGQMVHLEVYGTAPSHSDDKESSGRSERRPPRRDGSPRGDRGGGDRGGGHRNGGDRGGGGGSRRPSRPPR
jgi:uncharacterized protein